MKCLICYRKIEPNAEAWFWKLMYGPANILDGVIQTVTFGFCGITLPLWVAKNLAYARYKSPVTITNMDTKGGAK